MMVWEIAWLLAREHVLNRAGPQAPPLGRDAREPGNDASCTQRLAGKVRGVPLPANPPANDSATSYFRSGRAGPDKLTGSPRAAQSR
jgi:hypothetical protein